MRERKRIKFAEVRHEKGFVCHKCDCVDFRVWSTRTAINRVIRVRICRHCGYRIVTHETPAGAGTKTEPLGLRSVDGGNNE